MCKELSISIANVDCVKKRVKDLSRRSDDIKSRLAPTLKQLWLPERQLAVVSNLSDFHDLRARFPNFIEVIDLLESTAIGLHKLGLPYESPPIVLLGEPGLGKTLFVSEVAKLMALPFFEISLSTVSALFALTGSNIQWAEGSVGFVASSLSNSKFANPIILIDEIDKTGGGDKYNPLNAFYSLLEPHSAKHFKDEALEFEIDASRVIWIATANDKRMIPDPILSRMRVFDIHRPKENEMHMVVKSIYQNFRESKPYGNLLADTIPEDTMFMLSSMSPREARIAIDLGTLHAIGEHRTSLLPRDLPVIKKEKTRVGFY